MKTENHNNKCRMMRKSQTGLLGTFRSRIMDRLSSHVAHCPRCRRRLANANRVEVALMLIKTQPLDIGLLARANNKTLDVLKHSLRYSPKSAILRNARFDLSRLEKMRPGLERVLNTAACVFVILLIKTGVSNSLVECKDRGETVIRNYYARNLDSQTFDELFPEKSSSNA